MTALIPMLKVIVVPWQLQTDPATLTIAASITTTTAVIATAETDIQAAVMTAISRIVTIAPETITGVHETAARLKTSIEHASILLITVMS